MRQWTAFELDILKFGIERGYTARDMACTLPGRTLGEIGDAIALQISPKAEKPWRVKYVHSTAEDESPIAGCDRFYREQMQRASEEYDRRWRLEAAKLGSIAA
ncbi:MAG TPA: hypothetical protein VF389_11765 [Woeseiaceae bacterium]